MVAVKESLSSQVIRKKTMPVDIYVNGEYDSNPEDEVQQYDCTYCILGSASSTRFQLCESLILIEVVI